MIKVAIEKCRKEMVGRLTKPEETVKLLTTLASAALLLNAAATCGVLLPCHTLDMMTTNTSTQDRGHDVQAQMLYIETMSVSVPDS